jgi:hypothetical protein
MDAFNISAPSPDGQHNARLDVGGEIRFGPLYFSLAIDAYSFGQRSFGDAHLWSPDSALFAAQEWLTLDYSAGPITALLIIDLERGRAAAVARAVKGFIVPESFAGPVLSYRIEYAGLGRVEHASVDTTAIDAWVELP